jgi:hypothetical protein
MRTALRVTTRVLPGHRVEIVAPELTDGEAVEVFVVAERPVQAEAQATAPTLMEFLDSLPPGPRSAPTWEQIEQNFQRDRDSWDR